jgi:predicted Zn-dependent protease
MALSDEALAFVLAREIGHVVSQHHERNAATSLAISVLASALAPVVNVAKLLAVLYSGTTSATAASAVTSAASFASSRALIASYWPQQRQEADAIALRLMARVGYDARTVAAGFAQECPQSPPTRWVRELQESMALLATPAPRAEPARAAQAEVPLPAASAVE